MTHRTDRPHTARRKAPGTPLSWRALCPHFRRSRPVIGRPSFFPCRAAQFCPATPSLCYLTSFPLHRDRGRVTRKPAAASAEAENREGPASLRFFEGIRATASAAFSMRRLLLGKEAGPLAHGYTFLPVADHLGLRCKTLNPTPTRSPGLLASHETRQFSSSRSVLPKPECCERRR